MHEGLIDSLDSQENGYGPDENAPFGYMDDPKTGEKRAKKRPGNSTPKKKTATPEAPERSGTSPAVAPELPVDAESIPVVDLVERQPIERDEDRAPDAGRRRGGKRGAALVVMPKEEKPLPPFRAGPIAKGMNKAYRRIGKILRVANPMLGQAMIDMTKKEDPEDEDELTVGEAWEELAKTNPKIRRWLMNVVGGGAWFTLIMCHGPLLAAILMLDPVQRRFPLGRILLALMQDDDQDEEGDDEEGDDAFTMASRMFGSLDQASLAQMMAFAQQTADQAGARAAGVPQRG